MTVIFAARVHMCIYIWGGRIEVSGVYTSRYVIFAARMPMCTFIYGAHRSQWCIHSILMTVIFAARVHMCIYIWGGRIEVSGIYTTYDVSAPS